MFATYKPPVRSLAIRWPRVAAAGALIVCCASVSAQPRNAFAPPAGHDIQVREALQRSAEMEKLVQGLSERLMKFEQASIPKDSGPLPPGMLPPAKPQPLNGEKGVMPIPTSNDKTTGGSGAQAKGGATGGTEQLVERRVLAVLNGQEITLADGIVESNPIGSAASQGASR